MSPETRVVSVMDDRWLAIALGVIRNGGLVAFPTDTVYGLGGLAADGEVVRTIFQAKTRPDDKSIPVLLSGWSQLPGVALPTPGAERLAAAFWPGPLTIVLDRARELPAAIGPNGTVGVRAPDHPVALTLLQAVGPLATSSANLSGSPNPRTADDVLATLKGRIPLVVDGGPTPGGQPSTVIDCTAETPRLVRAGPVTLEAVLAAWQ